MGKRNPAKERFRTEPLEHKDTRRADGHEYEWRARYNITIKLLPGQPSLCLISGTSASPMTELTQWGALIPPEIERFKQLRPMIKVREYVIMPNHIHMVLDVTKQLKRHIGFSINGLKGGCSRAFARLRNQDKPTPIFKDNYNDRIIFSDTQFEAACEYVRENPRKLLIMRENPDLFHRYLNLNIKGYNVAAYGNMFLLKDFQKEPVRVHRADSPFENERKRKKYMACVDNGGVLVSPFISDDERAIKREALAKGGRIIRIQAEGMGQFYRPDGEEFELCRQGRLLIISPWPGNPPRMKLNYPLCDEMNHLADFISSTAFHYGDIRLLR